MARENNNGAGGDELEHSPGKCCDWRELKIIKVRSKIEQLKNR